MKMMCKLTLRIGVPGVHMQGFARTCDFNLVIEYNTRTSEIANWRREFKYERYSRNTTVRCCKNSWN